MAREPNPAEPEGSRVLAAWRSISSDFLARHFDKLFLASTLCAIGFILVFLDQKLSFLNFFFLPVLVAGYFVNSRSAVLGGLLSVAWVTLVVVIEPKAFYQEMTPLGLYLHLLLWASFLILTGALVGRLTERLRGEVDSTLRTLSEINAVKDELEKTNALLTRQNAALDETREKTEAALHAAMDPQVARLLIEDKMRNEKRPVTVLFADLVNFTRVTEESPPESVIEDLNRVFTAMEPVLARFRGHLDKYIGDGLMAEFGTPYPALNHPLLGLIAAVKMQERMAALDVPWKLRIGMASGTSIVGLMGSRRRKNFTAVGDTVNLAARLQALCPIGKVCVDENVYKFAGRWFHVRRVRDGFSAQEHKDAEARLELIGQMVEVAPTPVLCMEAADLCSRLGDMAKALRYHKLALELDPAMKRPVEQAVVSALLTSEERGSLVIKGKKERVAAYEVTGLKDPLLDGGRLPAAVIELHRRLFAAGLPEDALLAIEAREGTLGHGPVVAALSGALAEAAGLDEDQVRTAFLAGYLHDAGKNVVPEHLLSHENRLEQLPQPDQELIKSHVGAVAEVLAELEIPADARVLDVIAQHHERFDGSGYPLGLKGAQIGLLARILNFADAYETLTAWRPSQDAWSPDAALAELGRDVAEGRLDPKLGEVFFALMRSGRRS